MSPKGRPHSHPCEDCHTPVDCYGTWERNHDGFPEAVCSHYHIEATGNVALVLCSSCGEARQAQAALDELENV